MASYNKVLLMGNLTRDIELRHTTSSQVVANIGLATNRRFRTAGGEDREETTFVDCEAWGNTAEIMAKYLTKGRPVFIEGRLKLDQWQDKDGNKHSKLRVVVESFQFIDGKGGGGAGGNGGYSDRAEGAPSPRESAPPNGAGRGAASGSRAGAPVHHEPVDEADIPF